jgi:predicted small lipoprotein YifL
MLRRSTATIIVCAMVFALAGCGIKGPLKLPSGKTAPAPTGLPPGAVPATTLPPAPDNKPPPSDAPADDKDKKE